MTGWTVWARFVGSADEESKVSTSKVESHRIRCLPVTRDARQLATLDPRPSTFDLRTERTRQGDGGLAGANADFGDERLGDGAAGDGPSEQCESRRMEGA